MSAKEHGYNGWKNYETWSVKLWIDNDQGSEQYWNEVAQEVWEESAASAQHFPLITKGNVSVSELLHLNAEKQTRQ